MKTVYFLACLALGLAGCTTAFDRAPNPGGWGEYGFTYDLNASPSPFVDTSYRPLTPADLAAPLLIVVTNQAPPHVIFQTAPQIGVTEYAGEVPISAYNAPYPQFYEAAGANRAPAGGAAGANVAQPAAAAGPGGYNYGGEGGTVIGPITNITEVVTNTPGTNGTNITGINTNSTNAIIVVVTNTNGIFGLRTNFFTNNFAHGTNRFLNEAAGARRGTNANTPQFAPQQLTPAERQNLTPQQQQQLEQFRQQQFQQQQQFQRQQQIQRLQQQPTDPAAASQGANVGVPSASPNVLINPTAPGQNAPATAPAPNAPNAPAPANNPAPGGASAPPSGATGGGHRSGNTGGGTSR